MPRYFRASCPQCTGQMLVDQLNCTYPTCSGGVILIKDSSLDNLIHDLFPNGGSLRIQEPTK